MQRVFSAALILSILTSAPLSVLFIALPSAEAATGFTKAQTGVSSIVFNNQTTVSCTLGSNPARGDAVMVGVLWFDGNSGNATAMTVADGNGNNYTVEPHNSGTTNLIAGQVLQAYLLSAPANASKTITATFSRSTAASGVAAIFCDDFTVTGGTAAYDSGATGSGTGGTIDTPTIPVSGSNELLYAMASDNNAVNNATGAWTANEGGALAGNSSEWILSASAPPAVGFAGSGPSDVFNAIGMSFKINTRTTLLKPPNNLGLVGYWSFNEGTGTTAEDFSGNKNNGALVNSPTWTSGKLSRALKFDGSTNYVNMGNIAALNGLSKVTVSAWVRSSAAGANNSQETDFVDKATCTGSAGDGPFSLFENRDGDTEFSVFSSGATFFSGSASFNVDDGSWHLVTGIYDGANVSIYVDGIARAATNYGSFTLSSTANNLEIGGHCNGANLFWNGAIDEVRIYNRALSASDVAKLYKSGATRINSSSADLDSGSSLERGLVGLWTMDGKDTNWKTGTETDESGNGNTGTLSGNTPMTSRLSSGVGKLGQALLTSSANNQYITMGDQASLRLAGSWSLAVWAKPAIIPTSGNYAGLITKADNLQNTNYGLNIDNGAVSPGLGWEIAFNGTAGGLGIAKLTTAISTGQWYHLVGVYDSTVPQLYLYVNGALAAQSTPAITPSSNAGLPSVIGYDSCCSGGSTNFDGWLDDARIYNRALTATEVKQLYKLGTAVIRPN